MEQAVDADPYKTFVVVSLAIPSELLDMARAKLSLIKATRHVKDKPVLVLALDGGFLVGRFVVPEVGHFSHLHFNIIQSFIAKYFHDKFNNERTVMCTSILINFLNPRSHLN